MRRPCLLAEVLGAAVLLATATTAAAATAPAAAATAPAVATDASSPAALPPVDDWTHVWEVLRVVEFRQAQPEPPSGVFVYYLGDSLARESVVGDEEWTRQLTRRAAAAGKTAAAAFTLGGHDQTFGMDESIVAALPATPAGRPAGFVLIGVGVSRFIGPPAPLAPASLDPARPGAEPPLSRWVRHRYDTRRPLALSRKRQLVTDWMRRRWPGFKSNLTANARAIGRLIRACRAKRLRPVLVDLPLDLRVAGPGLSRPRSAIRRVCEAQARRHGVKYLRFNRSLALRSSFFWDLHHLMRPGCRRWQSRLSDELVGMLPRVKPVVTAGAMP